MSCHYDEGHKVMLVVNAFDNIPYDIRKHDQEVYRISKVKAFKNDYYYELKGLKSKLGVPFSIHGDWLYDIGAWTE